MKAAIYTQPGEPEVLHIVDVADPVPGEGELLIRVEAISIEGGDLLRRRIGTGKDQTIVGYAAAGEIVRLGEHVTGFAIGQKVTTFDWEGSHATLRAVPAATSFVVPKGLDINVAAAIPVGPGTAAWALDLGAVQASDTVLVIGATGGVGSAAVQLAAKAGARVIGVAGNAASLEQLLSLGLSDMVTAGEDGAAAEVLALLGGANVDLIIDTVGGLALADGIETLRDGGRVVLVGVVGGAGAPMDPVQLLMHQRTIIGCMLGPRMQEPRARAMIDDLLASTARGEFAVPVDTVYPFTEIAVAHLHAERRGRLGRIIVSVDSENGSYA